MTLRLLSSLYKKERDGSVCDYDVDMCPKHGARKLEELSWESVSQTEHLKRRGSKRGSFGAHSCRRHEPEPSVVFQLQHIFLGT